MPAPPNASPPARPGPSRRLLGSDWTPLAVTAGFAPAFLFPDIRWAAVLMIPALAWIGRGLVRGRMIEPTPLDLPILVLLVQAGVTCVTVPDLAFSLPKIAGLAFGVLVYYGLVLGLKSEADLRIGLAAFAASGVLLAAFGLAIMERNPADSEKGLALLMRIRSSLPRLPLRIPGAEEGLNTNAVAGTLLLFVPWIALVVFGPRRTAAGRNGNRAGRGAAIFGMILCAFVLLVSMSRGAWIALAASGAVLGAAFFFGRKRRAIALVTVLGALAVLVAVYIALVGAKNVGRSANELLAKFGGRTQAWSVGLEAAESAPWTGIGMNRLRLRPGIGYGRAHAHNQWIHTAAEMGIPSLIGLLAVNLATAAMCLGAWKRGSGGTKRAALGLGWGQLAYGLFGISDAVPLGAKAGIFFWVSLAMITAAHSLSRAEAAGGTSV